jgi:hypothetical protein
VRIHVISVNHGTNEYAELMLRSLIAHHRRRDDLTIALLCSGPEDLSPFDWALEQGVEVAHSGYGLEVAVTTHGEILRDAVRARPDTDAYLFVDADVCFLEDGTIDAMADELTSTKDAFAIQARWLLEDGTEFTEPDPPGRNPWIRQSVRPDTHHDWSDPVEYQVAIGDRVHPFCTLLRNDAVFRSIVENIGLSPGMTECVDGGGWWDTLGLLTQAMKTHGRTWRLSGRGVLHFGNVSWSSAWATEKAARRDALLERYRQHHQTG